MHLSDIETYCQPIPGTRFLWSPMALARRLTGHPYNRYSLHLASEAMLVASPRTIRSVPVVLATCFLPSGERRLNRRQIHILLRAAAAFHRRPVFIYAGMNTALTAPPGTFVPQRVKPPILLQGRFMGQPNRPIAFDRCELLDFDFI